MAASPTHITGFFEIRDQATNPLARGSRGAGVCLDLELETSVETRSDGTGVQVMINGKQFKDAIVSEAVALSLLKDSGNKNGLRISHKVPVPIASGFGTSGAAALGVALAGSEALGLDLSPIEASQVAHAWEIELRTGLGTVAAEFSGGLEMRVKEGAPGYGEVLRTPLDGRHCVVALHHGPLPTPEFLSNTSFRRKIGAMGGAFVEEMRKDPTPDTFMRLSRRFSSAMGFDAEFAGLINDATRSGFEMGVAMFGRTLFTVVKEADVPEISKIMERGRSRSSSRRDSKLIVSQVNPRGARRVS